MPNNYCLAELMPSKMVWIEDGTTESVRQPKTE